MSNQYFNSNRVPLGANTHPGAQIQFFSSNPAVTMPANYPMPAQGVMPGQPYVQHVVVPVAVPVQSGNHGQPVPFYSVTGITERPLEKAKRNSDELNYYLGNETSRRSRQSRSRSRSHDRHSGDWSRRERPRSRNNNYDRSRSAARPEKDYERASRSPEGSKHSRHSASNRHSESRHSVRHTSQEYSRESRDEYRDSRGSNWKERDEKYYSERENTDIDSHRQNYEERQIYDDVSDRYSERSENAEETYHRSSDRYSDYDKESEESRRKQWNDSLKVLQGKPRRYDNEREDPVKAKRRKYDDEYEPDPPRGGEGRASYDKEYCSVRDRNSSSGYERKSYEREYQDERQRDLKYERHDEYERQSDYNRNYERGTDYNRHLSEQGLANPNERRKNELKVHVDNSGRWIETKKSRGESVVDRSREGDQFNTGDRYKNLNITIENESAHLYDKIIDTRTHSDTVTHHRDSYGLENANNSEERRDNREPRYSKHRDSRIDRDSIKARPERPILIEDGSVLDGDRPIPVEDRPAERNTAILLEDGAIVCKDRPTLAKERPILREDRTILCEDGAILREDRPILLEDGAILREDRPILLEDGAILREAGPILLEDREGRPILVEDRCDNRRKYPERKHLRKRSNEYSSHSYKQGSQRSDFDDVSDSESVGLSSNRSCRSHTNRPRSMSPVLQNDKHDFDGERAGYSQPVPPHHTVSSSSRSSFPRNPNPLFQALDSDIPFEVPVICLNYSSRGGCQDIKCPNWHVCRHFVKGRCEYGENCKRGHSFFVGNIYKTLYEHNNMKINFRQLNQKHITYRIIGKLRAQMKEMFDKSDKVVKTEPGVKIDPEFDASNYDETGKFIKQSENEKSNEIKVTEESNVIKVTDESNEIKVTAESKDKMVTDESNESVQGTLKNSSKVESELKKDGKIPDKSLTEKAKDSHEESKDNEKSGDLKESNSDSKQEKNKAQTTIPNDSDIKNNTDKKRDVKENTSSTKKEKEKDQTGSLSPVSVENIDNWEKYERYDKVSEDDGLSDLSMDEDELENISSDEEVQKDEFPFNERNILAKAAIPIGMNDPLVFNPAKNAPPDAHLCDRPVRMNKPHIYCPMRNAPPPIRMPPNIHMPRANVSIPPPNMGMPPRAFNIPPPNIQMHPRPMAMNRPFMFNPPRNLPPPMPSPSNPLFPAAKAIDSHLGNQVPAHMQAQSTLPYSVPPPVPQSASHPGIPPINYLPQPSLLQEVIQSLQSSQNRAKKIPAKSKVAKRKSGEDLESLVEKNPELNEIIQTPWQFPHKGILNMSVIEFVTETEAYKEEFAAELMRILVTLDLPYVTMKKLMLVIKEKMLINVKSPVDMRKILSMYPDCFQVIETLDSDDEDDDPDNVRKNIQIKAKPSIGFCERHGYLPFAVGKCDCNALHICRFFFLRSCSHSKCKFGHKLKTDHNMTVFRSHKLHRLTGKEVMTFIRDVDNRHVEMVPEICKFYNREKGTCYKGDTVDADVICHKLHLCQFNAKGNCYYKPCRRSHSVRDKQPMALLQMYGLDPNIIGDDKALLMVRDVICEMEKKKLNRNAPHHTNKKGNAEQAGQTSSRAEDAIDNEKDIETSDRQNQGDVSPKKKPKVRRLNVKLPPVCKFYNNALGCKKRDWGPTGYCMFIHVCQHFITGDCKFGDKCKRSHDLVSGPAGELLQKHGLDTSQYTSREIADAINYPDEAVGSDQSSGIESTVKAVGIVKTEASTAVTSSSTTKVNVKATSVKSAADVSSYKSYSVEDILEQIIEKGREDEKKRTEQDGNLSQSF